MSRELGLTIGDLGVRLPWKLLSTSICPGTRHTVLMATGRAISGYCTQRLSFLQGTQAYVHSGSPCGPPSPSSTTTPTEGDKVPGQGVLHILQTTGRRVKSWSCWLPLSYLCCLLLWDMSSSGQPLPREQGHTLPGSSLSFQLAGTNHLLTPTDTSLRSAERRWQVLGNLHLCSSGDRTQGPC